MPFEEIKTKKEAQEFVDTFMVRGGSPIRVLGSVKGMSDAEFTECRRHGCDNSVWPFGYGGSDLGMIMGKVGARINLYNRLKYPDQYLHKEVDAATQHRFDTGHAMEPLIIKRFEHATGHTIISFDWQLVNEDYPHFIANMDALYVDKNTNELGVLEIKFPQDSMSQAPWVRMAKTGNMPGFYEAVSYGYRYQCYGYCAATRLPMATIVGGTGLGLNDIGYTRLNALPLKEAKALMEKGERFIRNTARGILPDEDDTENVKAIVDAYAEMGRLLPTTSNSINLPPDLLPAIKENETLTRKLDAIEAEIKDRKQRVADDYKQKVGYKELHDRKREVDAAIATAMGNHENGIIKADGEVHSVVYRNKESRGFDQTAFKQENPDLYKKYSGMHKTSTRPIVCKWEEI